MGQLFSPELQEAGNFSSQFLNNNSLEPLNDRTLILNYLCFIRFCQWCRKFNSALRLVSRKYRM